MSDKPASASEPKSAVSQSSGKGGKGRGRRDRRGPRNPMEAMSIVDDEEKLSDELKEFFKSNKCNCFIGVRLPESLRQVMFESLYYMVDFRRFDRRRLHLTDPGNFHTTLLNLAVPKDDIEAAVKAFEGADVASMQKMNLEFGKFGSFPGPHVYCPLTEKGGKGENIKKAVQSLSKAMSGAGFKCRTNDKVEQLHCTLVKPVRLGGKKRTDRGLSEAKFVQHVLSEDCAKEYDWSQNGDKVKDIADVDLPADSGKQHHVVSVDLCAMAETDAETGYYKVLASKKVNVGMQITDVAYFQRFMKDVEVDTGKRVKTGAALKEAEEEKAKKREERRAERKAKEEETAAKKSEEKPEGGKGRRRRRGKGKGKKDSAEDGEETEAKEDGEKKEGGKGRRRTRGKGRGKGSVASTDSKPEKKEGDKKEGDKDGEKKPSKGGKRGSKGRGKRNSNASEGGDDGKKATESTGSKGGKRGSKGKGKRGSKGGSRKGGSKGGEKKE